MDSQFPAIRRVHDNLVMRVGLILQKAAATFDLRFRPRFVIYAGVGIGAGWGTRFGGRRAVLFGLENAAERAGQASEWRKHWSRTNWVM